MNKKYWNEYILQLSKTSELYAEINNSEESLYEFINFNKLFDDVSSLSTIEQSKALNFILTQLYYGENAAFREVKKLLLAAKNKREEEFLLAQLVDEKNHIEMLDLYIHKNFNSISDINNNLKSAIDAIENCHSVIYANLGMQIIIEGSAYSLLNFLIENSKNTVLKKMLVKIKTDEAKHCYFGSLQLQEISIDHELEDWIVSILSQVRSCYIGGLSEICGKKFVVEIDFLFPQVFLLLKKIGFNIESIKQKIFLHAI